MEYGLNLLLIYPYDMIHLIKKIKKSCAQKKTSFENFRKFSTYSTSNDNLNEHNLIISPNSLMI